MRKIAILSCLDACQVCTGAACFQAWNEKKKHFSCYSEEDVSFAAFFHCNGCGKDPAGDKGMKEKLDRLQSMGVDTVHTGVCTMKDAKQNIQCPNIAKILDMLHERGIQTVQGTH